MVNTGEYLSSKESLTHTP